MELILWRHAEAEDAGAAGDHARNLTKHGRKQAERMAEWLRPRLEGPWRVLASPAARAIQTVTPLGLDYEVRPALSPLGSAESLLEEAGWPWDDRVLVVGHQPTLGEVAAQLLGGRGDIAFRKGAIWWFATRHREGGDDTVLRAVLSPDLLTAG